MGLKERFDSIINEIENIVGSGTNDIPTITQGVARSSGLELRLLADAFRFMTDMTLGEYIKRRLLIRALDIKVECNLPVEEVCDKAGYTEAASFSKACKNLFGHSPSQFTSEMLSKHSPLFFDRLTAGKDADQMECDTLITTKENNTICGVPADSFADIKQILEVSAIYGFTDEEAESVYQLAKQCEIAVAQAAEFFDDFKLQIENGSVIPGLDLYSMAVLACKYALSFSEAQSVVFLLEKNGYGSIHELPEAFFDIYFSRENAQFAGWDVAYIYEIAVSLEENGLAVDDLDDIAELASINGVSITEVIEDYDSYQKDWDDSIMKLMHHSEPDDAPLGFGYRSIWEKAEEQMDGRGEDDVLDDEEAAEEEDNTEAAIIANTYRISLRDAQEIIHDLQSHGYYSINDLPEGFFSIYFHYDMDQFVGWDIPYVCEIAEAMIRNNISADELENIMFLASAHNVDPADIIEDYDNYCGS